MESTLQKSKGLDSKLCSQIALPGIRYSTIVLNILITFSLKQ